MWLLRPALCSAQSTVTGHFRESETTICTGRTTVSIDTSHIFLATTSATIFGILRCQQLWLWLSNSHDLQCRLTHDFYNAKNFEKDGAMVSIVSCVGRYLTAQLPRQVSINSFWYRTSISNCICDKFPDPWYCCVGAETIAILISGQIIVFH